MIQLALTLAAGLAGYLLARGFVHRRLRFVDAAQSPLAPVVAGALAALAAWPLALLPMVTLATTIVFGVGTALGTASGARLVRRDEHRLRRLTP
jgi:CHASE2 domain-containing sensor protein